VVHHGLAVQPLRLDAGALRAERPGADREVDQAVGLGAHRGKGRYGTERRLAGGRKFIRDSAEGGQAAQGTGDRLE
jgi:hypothetical protein